MQVLERRRSCVWTTMGLVLVVTWLVVPGLRAEDKTPSAQSSEPSRDEVDQLKQELHLALEGIHALQRRLDELSKREHADETGQSGAPDAVSLQEQIDEERDRVEAIEQRLDRMASLMTVSATTSVPPSDAPSRKMVETGYDGGFFVRTDDNKFSVKFNGLAQLRYTGFEPHNSNLQFAPGSGWVNNLDVYLGRLAVSGTAFDPSVSYFFQFQGITATDSNSVSMLDWFVSKSFSKYLSIQAGRSWTPYSYEYYDNPGNYLFADLSTAEYAFALPRAIGAEASGQAGKLSYAFMLANSVRGLDAGGQDNFNSKLAYIGHFQYDIMAPYGYVETNPNRAGASKPQLSFWGSAAYNPVASPSSFENVAAGDSTVNATSTIGFRYRFFTLQTTGYYRKTRPFGGGLPDNSYGYGEQAGYYLIPGRLELAERISGVNWGAFHFGPSGFSNTWFAGPSFPYHRVQEDSLGLNYYFHGHNAKVQAAYSYLHGNNFDAATYGASRLWIQSQLMF